LKAWEAIMSSPIHHAKDLDAALMYAPPWAREQGTPEPFRPSAALSGGRQRLKPAALSAHEYSGDRDMARLQRQLTLSPDRVPAPPTETIQSLLPMVGRLCGVAAVAAAVAWLMISYPSVQFVRSEVVRIAASAPQPEIVTPKSDPLRTEAGAGLLMQHGLAITAPAQPPVDSQKPDDQQPAASASQSRSQVPPPRSVETIPVTVSLSEAAQPSANPLSSDNRTVLIDSDEIATLLKRGKEALTDGDLAAARLLLRRAADGGSAEAAFALGTTFDPAALRKLHAIGAEPDAAKAREWYEKAAQLGSPAASEKLAKASQ
jgi:hypothetical protein